MTRKRSHPIRKGLRFARLALAHDVLGVRAPAPRWLTLNVTGACNMRCRHCEAPNFNHSGKDLTLDEIRALSRQLGALDAVGLGGGEPFLRRDIDEIAVAFGRGNRASTINLATNGSFPERVSAKTQSIVEQCPETRLVVVVSLDGFEKTHDEIRQATGAFEGASETGRRLVALRARFPNLEFVFNATLHAGNYTELPSLAGWVEREFRTSLEFNVMSGEPRDGSMSLPEGEALESAVDALFEAGSRKDSRGYLEVFRQLRQEMLRRRRFPVKCQAGNLAAIVFANGDVHACPLRPAMGNLRERSFQEIWTGAEARKEFREIRAEQCACTDDCFLSISMSYSVKAGVLMARSMLR
jgi:MoaA/NifB/PqqE/SkfB family radical SAM enzyme